MSIVKALRDYSFARRYRNAELSGEYGGDLNIIKTIGGIFVCPPSRADSERDDIYSLTPIHGRSAVCYYEEKSFFAIKGSGWSYGGPLILKSPKENSLTFGLFEKKLAAREFAVSSRLQSAGVRAGRVIGWHSLEKSSLIVNASIDDLINAEPALLYTNLIFPLRVADLSYLTPEHRILAIEEASVLARWNYINQYDFILNFIRTLTASIDQIHDCGGVFDGLSYDNVTLAAEILDFEWFFLPGLPLPDGSSDQNLYKRQRKSLIYLAEIGYQLASLLNIKLCFNDIVGVIEDCKPRCAQIRSAISEVRLRS